MLKEYNFPVYRKYKDLDTWFKILSEDMFVEIKKVGNEYMITKIEATKYPEKMFIMDMLKCEDGRWEPSSKELFEKAEQEAS